MNQENPMIDTPTTSLDEAWVEAEAALPEGSTLSLARFNGDPLTRYRALVSDYRSLLRPRSTEAVGPTPAAALHALAAKLRETDR